MLYEETSQSERLMRHIASWSSLSAVLIFVGPTFAGNSPAHESDASLTAVSLANAYAPALVLKNPQPHTERVRIERVPLTCSTSVEEHPNSRTCEHPNSRTRLTGPPMAAPSASDPRRGASDGEVREDARYACPRDGAPIRIGPTGRDAAGRRRINAPVSLAPTAGCAGRAVRARDGPGGVGRASRCSAHALRGCARRAGGDRPVYGAAALCGAGPRARLCRELSGGPPLPEAALPHADPGGAPDRDAARRASPARLV